jgi:hypothetical protein
VRGELRDLVAEALQRRDARMSGNEHREIGRHGRVLLRLERLYTRGFAMPESGQDART